MIYTDESYIGTPLNKSAVDGLKEYTAVNLLSFLTRQTDKDLMSEFVSNLKK